MLMLIFVSVSCVDFNDSFKRRYEQSKKAIQAVNNRQAFGEVAHLLVYKPIYRHMIPHKTKELARISFLPMHIEG